MSQNKSNRVRNWSIQHMLNILNQIQITLINVTLLFMLASLILIAIQSNPVFAVFGFITTALSAFTFLILIGAEFFALTILIIYTGVIAVLFLFVVIMFNMRELKTQVRSVVFNPITAVALLKVFFMYELLMGAVRSLVDTTVHLEAANLHTLDVVHFVSLFNEH